MSFLVEPRSFGHEPRQMVLLHETSWVYQIAVN